MKCAIKIAAYVLLIGMLAIDIGLQSSIRFGAPTLEGAVRPEITQSLINSDPKKNEQQTPPLLDVKWTDIALLIVIAFQAWIYWRQVGIMRGQLSATQKAADAAATQAATSSRTIDRLERPHIFPICNPNFIDILAPLLTTRRMYDHPSNRRFALDSAVPTVILQFRNYGKSPAIITQVAACIVVWTDDPGVAAPRWLSLPEERVLLPGDSSSPVTASLLYPMKFFITPEDFDNLHAGNTYWWLYGHITYEDVLDTIHQHFFAGGLTTA